MGDKDDLMETAEALARATSAGELSEDQADRELGALQQRLLTLMVAEEISDEELHRLAERTGLGISVYRESDDQEAPTSGG